MIFMSDQWNLKALLSFLTPSYNWALIPPSSFLLIQVYDDLTLEISFNDEVISPQGDIIDLLRLL